MSVILRTAGIDRSAEELAWDLENLLTVWTAILNVVLERPSPFLIYRESDSVVRALRDYLTSDIGEILIDDEATYKDAHEFVEQVMPQNLKKLKHYVDPVPLFTRFQIESQIESAFAHTVTLPSGGSIVIDHTEAMVSIDVNSARATKGGDIEATALNTNLEAAEEVARQLRIRDLGGLIVIDFIDMGPQKHQRDVENRLREALRQDRARVQIGKISRFGLLEMSRQRLRPSIGESAYQTCPRCSGFGTIRSVESLALAILRIIGEEARKERTAKVIAHLPVEVATYLLNEKRDWVQSLESRNDTQVVLVANSRLETPHYEVRRVRDDQLDLTENSGVSYELSHASVEPETPQAILERKAVEQPVVGVMKPTTPAPKPKQPAEKGFWEKLMAFFGGGDKETASQSRSAHGDGGKRTRGAQSSRRRSSSKSSDGRPAQRKRTGKKAGKKTSGESGPARKTKSASKKASSKKTATKKRAADADQRAPEDGTQQETTNEAGRESKPRNPRSRRSRGGRRRRRTAENSEPAAENRQADTSQSPKSGPSETKAVADRTPASEKPSAERGTPPQVQRDARPSQQGNGSHETTTAQKPVDDGDAARAPQSAAPPATRTAADSTAVPAAKRAADAPAQREASTRPEPSHDAKPSARDDGKGATTKPATTDSATAAEPKRAADAPPRREAPSQPAPSKEAKPAAAKDGEGATNKPASRLLPWEPQPAADLKPPSTTAAPRPAPEPGPAPARPPEPAVTAPAKQDSKAAEPTQD